MTRCNYHPDIDTYMRGIESGKIHACREQRQLVAMLRRVLSDPNIVFDDDAISGFSLLTERYFFPLVPAQKFIAALVLGCRYRDSGFLVFPEVFVMAGRGFGKNGFISALAFYLTSEYNNINGYNVDIVATSENQARTSFDEVYNVIKDMGDKGKRLYRYNLMDIESRKTRSRIKYHTSNARTKDGLRSGMVVFDEVHEYQDYDNIKVFRGGLGKVPDARTLYITTDGEVREGVLDAYKERAAQVLEGSREHNGFLPVIYKLDTVQEAGKPDLWDKANPRLPYAPELRRQLELEYGEIGYNESLKTAFLNKRMNIVYQSKDLAVASREDILATRDHEWPDLSGAECIGAVDFADLRDFAAVGLRWVRDGITYWRQHTFVHERALELTTYNIDITEAVAKGWMTIIRDEPTIPPRVIVEWFHGMASKYYIREIHCDSFRASALKQAFEASGYGMLREVRSGAISHNKVAPRLLQMFADRTIAYEDDKLMRWYTSNVKVITDAKGNKTFHKIEPLRRKTDGFFCLLHSLIDDELEDSAPPIYLDPIIL